LGEGLVAFGVEIVPMRAVFVAAGFYLLARRNEPAEAETVLTG
jgi:hypothetical protein